MGTKRLGRRIAVYILGLFLMAIGVAIAINSDLGISPVTSLPFVISLVSGESMVVVVTATFLIFILIQIILLRKNFKWINLTQILFSTIFGYFVDVARVIVGDFQIPTYFGQLLMIGVGIIIMSTGIILFVEARLVNLPMEGLVAAITQVVPNSKFHTVKMLMDSLVVILAIVVSLTFLGGLYAIREGTILTAVFVGKVMPYVRKVAMPVLNKVNMHPACSNCEGGK